MNEDEQQHITTDPTVASKISASNGDANKPPKPPEDKTKSAKTINNKLQDGEDVSLTEDLYAQYYDDKGQAMPIKRFTWKNKNKIQVQVISYGARVVSILLPDRKGELEDVLLGFDDLAGYLFYEKYYFGSVIGRVSNVIKNSTFPIGNKRFNVSTNYGKHSVHGGLKALDKVVWDCYFTGKKVIMSYISPHLSEGYPGALLVRVLFELSAKNEFKVSFDAQTTQPTCVDLSHQLYFNLAGHHAGPDEIYRHVLTLNCNCFTPQVNKIPTGEILNVIHTQYDFQIPRILGKVMGVEPKDGFYQNLCVNKGMYQQECFVGRLLHPPSGRMLEIYSNQPGVQLNTANDFGYGILKSNLVLPVPCKSENETSENTTMKIFEKMHEKLVEILQLDKEQNFEEIRLLISKLSAFKAKSNKESMTKLVKNELVLTPLQITYLKKAREIVCENEETDEECLDLKDVLSAVLAIVQEPAEPGDVEAPQRSTVTELIQRISLSNPDSLKSTSIKQSTSNNNGNLNKIPVYYKDSEQIRGKGRAIYKTHGAVALQTQNYPNAVNVRQFPSPLLNPGEVYRHEIVYRFWIRAGNPNKWIKRTSNDCKSKRK